MLPSPVALEVEDLPDMHLLGLILRSLITRNLADPKKALRAARLRGIAAVQAGEMKLTLDCQPGKLVLRRGHPEKARARVKGSLAAFLDIALGGGLVRPVLDGDISVGGNPFFLLRLLPLLRAPREKG
jgi:hypothetical protein